MTSWSTLAVFIPASLALIVIPGPNHLYITTRALTQGRAAGLASAFGVECGTLVHIAAAALGLSVLVRQSALLFEVVRWAGVAYLVYLGIRTLAGKGGDDRQEVKAQPLRAVFLEGVLVNMLNPKVALFFLAFLPAFVDREAGSPALQIAVFGLILFTFGLLSDVVYALAAGALGSKIKLRGLRVASGVVYLGLGAVTAIAGRR